MWQGDAMRKTLLGNNLFFKRKTSGKLVTPTDLACSGTMFD